jgi:hypothetical protein
MSFPEWWQTVSVTLAGIRRQPPSFQVLGGHDFLIKRSPLLSSAENLLISNIFDRLEHLRHEVLANTDQADSWAATAEPRALTVRPYELPRNELIREAELLGPRRLRRAAGLLSHSNRGARNHHQRRHSGQH